MASLLDDLFDPETVAKLKALSQPDEQQKQQALNNGLLTAGLGILANNTGNYGKAAPAIGAGGIMGLNNYNNTLQLQQRDAQEQLQMGMMLSKMKKEAELQDRQTKFMDSIPALFGGQSQPAPRPYQGQVSGAFQIDSPQQAQQLEAEYQKLLQTNPEEAAKVKEALVQQGLIKPSMQQSQPDWQKIGQAGVQASVAGMKGGEQLVKMADLMQPNIQYLDTGNGLMPYSKNGMPLPGAQMITKGMSPKEMADVQAKNAELAFKGIIPGGSALGVQPGNGLTPEGKAASAQTYAVETSKQFADKMGQINNADLKAGSNISKYQRIGDLLEGFDGSKLSPTGVDIAKFAKSVSFDIDPKLSNKEASAKIANEMALSLRDTSTGAGMPGAMSDADRNYLQSMIPSYTNSAAGRKQMISDAVAIEQRNQQVAKLARDYVKKNGQLDNDFYTELSQFSSSNPLFKPLERPSLDSFRKGK